MVAVGIGVGMGYRRPRRNLGQDGSAFEFLPGQIVDDGSPAFVEPPIVLEISDGIKFRGRKSSGASGKFIYVIGLPAPGTAYTLRYDPDWSQLENGGVTAMVGFGFKRGNDFRVTGLKGDGSTGVKAYELSGSWNQTTGFTANDGGAAAHGTQAGPNYLQIETASDNATYTLRTSADGVIWTDEFTDVVASPIGDLDNATQFGIAVFLEAGDAGPFNVDVTLWTQGAASSAALWTPAELGSALALWLKGDDLTGNDGDNIATWADASGNGRNFTQSTEADKPNLEVAELNGLNVLRFTQSNTEYLGGASLSGLAASASLFYVLRAVANDSGTGGPGHFGTHTTNNHYSFTDGNIYNGDLSTARKTVGNPTPSVANWNIFGITSAANDWKCYLGGTQLFSTVTNSVDFRTNPTIGQTNGVAYFDGFIAEVILCTGVLSQADREKVEGYAAHKWGITSVLDAGHPYKSSAPTV